VGGRDRNDNEFRGHRGSIPNLVRYSRRYLMALSRQQRIFSSIHFQTQLSMQDIKELPGIPMEVAHF
jgi:hypothetical protein